MFLSICPCIVSPYGNKKKQDYLVAHIPELVDLLDGSEQMKKVFREATARICATESPKLTPAEFFGVLHGNEMLTSRDRTRKTVEAIQQCIANPTVFPTATIASSLTTLQSTGTWPILFFKTLMSIATSGSTDGMTRDAATVTAIKSLLHRATVSPLAVWDHKAAWEGWTRTYALLLPSSLTLALLVPATALADLLGRYPAVRAQLVTLVDAKNLREQPRIKALWPVLAGAEHAMTVDQQVPAAPPAAGKGKVSVA
ncbi:hypothetical protein BC828DRAFT_378359 [Blastocladiella britannica]|nr:hypothetical protein BC828DRAFT_378359 [Blastocladiella britannica]